MGEVYLAQDPRLERNVAIKVLPQRLAQDREALGQFQYENKAVAALSHPNIRLIFDIGKEGPHTYAVMELLEGETLAQRLKRSRMNWKDAMRTAKEVALGLAAAHSKGITHRDIKPENIFLCESGEIKILDFGLALVDPKRRRAQDETFDTTVTYDGFVGNLGGTIPYMSPEQVRGEETDPRGDIFSFGSVLYEMLTGKSLFARDSAVETAAAILNEKTPSLAEAGVAVPVKLQLLVNLCLEKNPDYRIQSMGDIITMFKKIESDTPTRRRSQHVASVAVLPFVNMSKDTDDEYFSDGLTEELINSLVKIGGLYVASRTTSMLFKGKDQDVRDVGEQLNVRTVVEGSVRKSGDRLRITAQLINVEDGYHLWSDSFDRKVEDVFAVQGEIAEHIAKALHVVLSEKEKESLTQAPTENIKAYDLLLQGRQQFYHFQRKSIERALSLFLHAASLDPEFAPALAWASYCYSFLYSWFDGNDLNLKESETTSRKALSLDPDLAEAHVARGMALSLQREINAARREFETALRLKPDLYEAAYFYARNCFSQGQYDKAAMLAAQATEQRPEDYNAPYLLGMIYLDLQQDLDAHEAFKLSMQRAEKTLELFPDDARALAFGSGALNHLNEKQKALEWAEKAFASSPQEPMTLYAVACDFAMLGRADKAISCLERARLFGTLPKSWLENDPDLDSLRDRPRFQAFLAQLNE